MKSKILLLIALMVGTASLGLAGNCAVGTLASYIGTTCTIDGITFSNFGYTSTGSGGATAIPASSVAVTPAGLGLMFNAPWNVGPGQTLDSDITYTVTGTITDLVLSMGGFFFAPDGTVSVAETTNIGVNLSVFDNSGGTVSSASATFAPVSSINLTKDIAVNGNSGSAGVSQVFNQFSTTTTPEPASMLLLGSGLLGLGGYFRRRKTSK